VTGAENWKLGHDWRLVRSNRRHDATRLRCRQMFRLRLSPTSCEFNTHRRRDSTRQLSRVGVGGVYWALDVYFMSGCMIGRLRAMTSRCWPSNTSSLGPPDRLRFLCLVRRELAKLSPSSRPWNRFLTSPLICTCHAN